MSAEIQCYTCIYGVNNYGISCINPIANSLEEPIDCYNCEFYEMISESYQNDIKKVFDVMGDDL